MKVKLRSSSLLTVRSRAARLSRSSSTRSCAALQRLDLPDHRHQQAVGGIHRDADVDVLEQRAALRCAASYQALSPGSVRTPAAIARSTRVV